MGFSAAAAAAAAASIAGAAMQSSAAGNAAQLQFNASQNAIAEQNAMFQQVQGYLAPYRAQGESALGALGGLTGVGGTGVTPGVTTIGTMPGTTNTPIGQIALTGALSPELQATLQGGQVGPPAFAAPAGVQGAAGVLGAPLTRPFSAADLANTPGYQFTLGQGLQAINNSYAAQGQGKSGNVMAGGINYAEGLAGTTYNQQFANYLAQNQQIYNMVAGQAQLGEAAATGTAGAGVSVGSNVSNLLTQGGNALAAGQIGSANAISSGLNSAGNAPLNTLTTMAMINALQAQQSPQTPLPQPPGGSVG